MNTRYNRSRGKMNIKKGELGIKLRHICLVQTLCCVFIFGIFFFSKKINVEPIVNIQEKIKVYIKDSFTADDIQKYKDVFNNIGNLNGAGGLMEINEDNIKDVVFNSYNNIDKEVYSTINLQKPLDNYRITSEYGVRAHPISEKMDFHTGIDLASNYKEPIKASYYGVVTETGVDDIYGNYIKVKYGDNITAFYAHCDTILYKKNDPVKPNDTIALVGSTGVSTGNHLHFEIKIDDYRINPKQLVSF